MRRVTADEAVKVIRSGDTILVGGSGGGHAVPEALLAALERRFLAEGTPRDITALHPVGLGDGKTLGANHFAHEGLLRRIVCGTFVNSPKIAELALAEKIDGYTLPQEPCRSSCARWRPGGPASSPGRGCTLSSIRVDLLERAGRHLVSS